MQRSKSKLKQIYWRENLLSYHPRPKSDVLQIILIICIVYYAHIHVFVYSHVAVESSGILSPLK